MSILASGILYGASAALGVVAFFVCLAMFLFVVAWVGERL